MQWKIGEYIYCTNVRIKNCSTFIDDLKAHRKTSKQTKFICKRNLNGISCELCLNVMKSINFYLFKII